MTADAPLTRESFRRLHPISTPRPVSQLSDRVWTDEDWDRIQRGYRARDMDEKWNVFVEGDVLFMHRSWTGHGVYEVSFSSAAGSGRRIASAVVEADGERYRSMGDEYDRLMMELIISAIVLGEPAAELRAGLVELTARASGKSDLPSGVVEHSALGLRSGS
ncbi:hypothetical protein OHU11_00865 [Streptomyces sp. NBC_00257]|uniref:hypothetical protein n=1 Tax=Streptomyces TaxID=1883 RepID=UPI002252580A|nr:MULTISPECIES: hypothetical protein [unclassified Streptomyces]WTB59405.1 hypothetical protein OG832_43075 [Streptomyces sp. NBC_00826]WTH87724.1 hypothetical protein OIC43_00645 [Streptomyces sp. NBC_00825]WTH96450.1 hypothetical protein OHA23_00655 [Streptomyces sp. NBC_00822]MCX4869914.1 hypothetical protein [Streptomyces sp. NBC_00906]MCX4901077.1 hypothetical protein [Streptomyces sp. NBC_00892]